MKLAQSSGPIDEQRRKAWTSWVVRDELDGLDGSAPVSGRKVSSRSEFVDRRRQR